MKRNILLGSAVLSLVAAAALISTFANRNEALALHAMPCGDFDADGDVDGSLVGPDDLDLILAHFGFPVPPTPAQVDLNGDTIINGLDLFIFAGLAGPTICQDTPVGPPTDYDADGCTNVEEMAVPPFAGGSRDIYNHWDFYDVPTGVGPVRDGAITGVDFFALLSRFGAIDGSPGKVDPPFAAVPAAPAYHSSFDRSAAVAPFFPVDLGPPDGAITGFDFFAMLMQFGHTC